MESGAPLVGIVQGDEQNDDKRSLRGERHRFASARLVALGGQPNLGLMARDYQSPHALATPDRETGCELTRCAIMTVARS